MPARGSGIGASSLGVYAAARAGTYSSSGAMGGRAPTAAPALQTTSAGGYGAVTPYLLGLVAVEVLALVWLRRAFASYHGG